MPRDLGDPEKCWLMSVYMMERVTLVRMVLRCSLVMVPRTTAPPPLSSPSPPSSDPTSRYDARLACMFSRTELLL